MENALPLEGIKVIELAAVVAAPTAGRILADFGAEVIKIETPVSGDPLRFIGDMTWLPHTKDNNPMFDHFNTGKKLTAVNLKSEEGMDILFRLLESADVLISNTRMKSLKKMGLDYESLHKRFPRLIYAHFSGFGNKGPDKDRPGYDTTAFWMRTGSVLDMVCEGDFPARPSYAFGDIASASYLLNGILIALLGREKTGLGTMVETSLFASGIWMNGTYVINTQPQYGNVLPHDRYEPWHPFSDCFKCSDGIWIAPLSKNYSKDLAFLDELFGLHELVEDEDYQTVTRMKESGKEAPMIRHLEQIISTKTSEEWKEIFEKADLPYEIVRHIKDIPSDPQAIANGYLETVEYPEGNAEMPIEPIKFSEYSKKPFKRQGYIGADTDEVMKEYGYSDEQISELKEKKVIQ